MYLQDKKGDGYGVYPIDVQIMRMARTVNYLYRAEAMSSIVGSEGIVWDVSCYDGCDVGGPKPMDHPENQHQLCEDDAGT